jgi:hypothetical protein
VGKNWPPVGEAQTTVRRKEEERLPLSPEGDSPRRQFVMGDVFPDFDSMTPEEQMAWLESLAKRQGVNDEELTTKADLDIPVPEDGQVDEPGYVPFEGSVSARKMKEAQDAAKAEAEPEPIEEVEKAEEPARFEVEAAEAIEEIDILAEAGDFEVEAAEPVEEADIFAEVEAVEAIEEIDILAEAGDFEAEAAEPVEEADIFAEVEAAEPVEEADIFAEAGDMVDPMLWLDSLAAQPEGDREDLSDLFADSEEYAVEEGEQEMLELESPELPALDEFAAAEAQPGDDLLDGVDPMRWLESLAKRQGVRSEELLTSADLDVDEVPDGTVIDEPGYVPFEGSASARKIKETAEVESEPELIPEPEISAEPAGEIVDDFSPAESLETEEFVEPEPAQMADEEEMLSGADPMRWLESLAKRQGAKPEEFLTQADLDIPELPEDTVIDEPGYVEYSPFSILPPDQEIEMPEEGQLVAEGAAGPEAEDEVFSWLEDLATEPDQDLSELLAFGDEMFEPVAEDVEPEIPAAEAPVQPADSLEGMTDEEVAYAQAHGQLTGEQELAWLKRQAAKLAQARASQEVEMIPPEDEGEIVPAELPPWLEQMREEAEQVGMEEADLVAEEPELSSELADFSEWLEEVPAGEAELDLAELALDTAELTEADVDSLWGEAAEAEFELEDVGLPDDSELAKFLAEGFVPEGADPLAEALDAEYERKLIGDESEPEWYTEAVAQVAAEDATGLGVEVEQATEMPEEPVVEASLGDMPDWLKETEEQIRSALAEDEAMPEWLRETGDAEPTVEEKTPEWFAEQAEAPAAPPEEELPDWLRELDKPLEAEGAEEAEPTLEAAEPVAEVEPAPAPAPEPEPVKPAPAPAPVVEPEIRKPAPAAPLQGELFEKITQRLKEDPNDHATRLAFARALRDNRQLVSSLDQYETLIDTAQLLQDVSNDLGSLTEEHSEMARVRRLLGDAYMRRGMLQEALNAYRGALEQL